MKLSDFIQKYEDFNSLSVVIDENLAGARLDSAVTQLEPSLTRSSLKTLDNAVLVNGKESKLSSKLKIGDKVDIYWSFNIDIDFAPEKIDFPILYKDEDLMIIDKPWGLVVHPAKGHETGTLANGILYYLQQHKLNTDFGDQDRVGIVHRLDKDTRGLMIIALNEKTSRALSEMFKNREITKVYKAIVKGVTPDHGTIFGAIGRSLNDRKKMAVLKNGGRDARTDYKVLQHFKEHTLSWLASSSRGVLIRYAYTCLMRDFLF